MNIVKIIESLRIKRYIFHSEADFQFALAWEINTIYPTSKVRLEVPYKNKNKSTDILVLLDDIYYPIELKYKTALFTTTVDDELFCLRNQLRTTESIPEFIEDIERVEKLSNELNRGKKAGFVIWLTNEKSYWSIPKHDSAHEPFFVHEGARINGPIERDNRQPYVEIQGEYIVHWNEYHTFSSKNGIFKYVLLSIS